MAVSERDLEVLDIHVNDADATDVVRRIVDRPTDQRHRRTPRWWRWHARV